MTTEIENRLRETLTTKAETITASRLAPLSLSELSEAPAAAPHASRRPFAIAVAVVAVVAIGAAAVLARNIGSPEPSSPLATQPATPPAAAGGRAWPLTNDEPLTVTIGELDLSTPDSVARGYATQVIGLPSDWQLDAAQIDGPSATVHYVLQDVPASITLALDDQGLWFVTSAATELASGGPIPRPAGVDVSVGPGPRTYEGGADVRISAVSADGTTLDQKMDRVVPPSGGSAGAARVTPLRWAGTEAAAAVRVDVLSDHDSNPATADVVVGHWTAALAAPRLEGLPASVDLESSEAVFQSTGLPKQVAVAYMQDRFPDYPAPGIKVGDVVTRATRAWVDWGSIDGIVGRLFLRRTADAWAVVVATTEGVDLNDLKVTDGRVHGRITSTNVNSLFADVLRPDGTPVPGSPRPEGMPDAQYRFGTAGGPSTHNLDLDVALDGAARLRVNLVGGTILSISEVAVAP